MNPKRKEQKDTSSYRNLGVHSWQEFTSEHGTYDAGKANMKPRVEFLHPQGHDHIFYDHERRTILTVHYDSEYVFDHYFKKIVVSMGWLEDGTLNTRILKMFLDDFYKYCEGMEEKVRAEKLEQQVKELMQTTGKTEEEVRQFLLGNKIEVTPVQQESFASTPTPPQEEEQPKATAKAKAK